MGASDLFACSGVALGTKSAPSSTGRSDHGSGPSVRGLEHADPLPPCAYYSWRASLRPSKLTYVLIQHVLTKGKEYLFIYARRDR